MLSGSWLNRVVGLCDSSLNMGKCLSKDYRKQQRDKGKNQQKDKGKKQQRDDERSLFTPDMISSGSHLPSGRYHYGNSPEIPPDIGNRALGALIYKRGGKKGASTSHTTLEALFRGGSGRNKVQHADFNDIRVEEYSFTSDLASPLLQGFDVHAMKALAESYAESAAKAAARDAFVFLQSNDSTVNGFHYLSTGEEDSEDGFVDDFVDEFSVDDADELAKSFDSEDWDEHNSRSFQYWNERLVAVMNAVHARAQARRQLRGKFVVGTRKQKKTVRFRLPEVEEEFTDDDIRSGTESELDEVRPLRQKVADDFMAEPASTSINVEAEYPDERFGMYGGGYAAERAAMAIGSDYYVWLYEDEDDENGGEEGLYRRARITEIEEIEEEEDPGESLYRKAKMSPSSEPEVLVFNSGPLAEEEEENAGERLYRKAKISQNLEAEVLDYNFSSGPEFHEEGSTSSQSAGAATPLIRKWGAPSAPPSPPAGEVGEVEHRSQGSWQSAENYLPEPDLGMQSPDRLEEEFEDALTSPAPEDGEKVEDNFNGSPGGREDSTISSQSSHPVETGSHEEGRKAENFRGLANGGQSNSRQFRTADSGRGEAGISELSGQSGGGDESSAQAGKPSPKFVKDISFTLKDISVSNDSEGGRPGISMGSVVVESRMSDGSKLNPQILDLSGMSDGSKLNPQILDLSDILDLENPGVYQDGGIFQGESSASSFLDPNLDNFEFDFDDEEFTFPVFYSAPSSPSQSPQSSPGREDLLGNGIWRALVPNGNPESPIRNGSIGPHLPYLQSLPPQTMSTIPASQFDAIETRIPNVGVSDDRVPSSSSAPSSSDRKRFSFSEQRGVVEGIQAILSTIPNGGFSDSGAPSSSDRRRCSFSEPPVVTERVQEIVSHETVEVVAHKVVTLNSKPPSATPVFSPTRDADGSVRPNHADKATSVVSPFLPTIKVSAIPYPPKSQGALDKVLNLYFQEKTGTAAGAPLKHRERERRPPTHSD